MMEDTARADGEAHYPPYSSHRLQLAGESPSRDPGRELQRLRREAGLTQAELGEFAGVAERTVRGIETGHIKSPRRQSLLLLASALKMDVASGQRFMAGWGFRTFESVNVDETYGLIGGMTDPLISSLTQENASIIPLYVTDCATVGPDGRVTSRHTEELTMSAADGVAGRRILYDVREGFSRPAQVRLDDLHNCWVIREKSHEKRFIKEFELSYGRHLRRGQTQLIRYTAKFTHDGTDDDQAPHNGAEICGFLRPPRIYVLELIFQSDLQPSWCTQVFQGAPATEVRTVSTLELTASNTVHVALSDPRPGGHGIAWGY